MCKPVTLMFTEDSTNAHSYCYIKVKKKLKPHKFFMGKPSQNYGVPPKYGAHNFTWSPT